MSRRVGGLIRWFTSADLKEGRGWFYRLRVNLALAFCGVMFVLSVFGLISRGDWFFAIPALVCTVLPRFAAYAFATWPRA